MESRSTQGRSRDISLEQDECCDRGHSPSLLLRTGQGGRLCLLCVSGLISDRDAFLIHRTYAVEELSTALTDSLFSNELLNRHPKFFVTSLSDAVGSSMDDKFCEGVMAAILSLCRSSRDTEESLVEDFMRRIVRQLGCPSLWFPDKCVTLHLMGLLLEIHCEQELCVPQAIRNLKDFVPNLIAGLQLPGEALQEEIFYILFKLASLDDGVEQFVLHSVRLCFAAIQTLLKTESDSLRMNCIALLSVMATRSIFDIRLDVGSSAPGRENNVHSRREIMADDGSSFVKIFAEAMKGSLLSSDLQVQASALQLICFLFPEGASLDTELQILLEGGIVDYIFEVIRLSDNREHIQGLAVDVLNLLSAEQHIFPHRLKFGLDTVIGVLAQSIDSHSTMLQTSVLHLLSRSISYITETLSTPRAEHLMLLLTKILQNHAKAVDDHALTDDTNVLPLTFNGSCLALISLTQAPACAGIPDVSQILQTATASAIMTTSSAAKVNPDSSTLTYSACLLQEVYKFNKRQIVEADVADNTAEALVGLCELYLLPAFVDSVAMLDDERLALTFLQTFTLLLKTEALECTRQFASKLISNRCFTLSFELMGRFPANKQFKETNYKFLSALVNKLAGCTIEAYVDESLEYLPSDPSDLLILLEQRSAENQQLQSAHRASIAILSTSYTCSDRLAKETDIVASLEQHLLINDGSAIAPDAILKQFVSLYASSKDALKRFDAVWSAEAERVLELVVGCSNCNDLLSSEISKPVLKWFLKKESLKDANASQLLAWFTVHVQNKCSGDGPQESNSSALLKSCKGQTGLQSLATLAELIANEDCGTAVLIFLFDSLVERKVDDEIRIVAQTFTDLSRISLFVGNQLVQRGLLSTLQQIIRNYNCRAADSTLTSCLELLFQLLYDSHPTNDVVVNRSWLDIATQCASFVLRKMKSSCDTTFEVVAPLSVVNLILHKSNETDFFTQACEFLVCNRNLCTKVEAFILVAASQAAKLSQVGLRSAEGELLCAAVIFCLLRLRCALRFEHQMNNFSDEKQYIGFEPSVTGCSGTSGEKLSRSSLTCEHWCRILYFGPPFLKTLSCCCIAEIFSQLPVTSEETMNDSERNKECGMPVSFFTAVTMVLQGSILGDCERIQKIAGGCLSRLLRSNALSLQRKQSVANSPWNHTLLENLMLSLSANNLNQNPGTVGSQARFSAAYVAVALLKMSPPPSYLPFLFSESSITGAISNLCEADISPVIVSFFHELLLSKYLTDDHVQILRGLFQATRRITYGRGFSLQPGDGHSKSTLVGSKIVNVDHCTDHIILSAILELAITFRDEALDTFRNDVNNTSISQGDSGAFTSLLDTFMQDSYLQFK